MCLSVIKVVIVDYGQTVRVFVFFHNIECVIMVLRILNLEEHQNCMIGSKVTTILPMFFILLFRPSESRDAEGFSRGRSVAVAVGVSDRWHVSCDM